MRLLVILSLALGTGLLGGSVAFGHAAPERFDPSPGAILAQAPARVDGWFTQDIRRQEGVSFIQVFDAQGNQVDDGAPVIDDADRRHMYVGLQSGLGPGRYLVAWQTLSDEDDEVDGGCFLFFVGQEAAAAAHQERVRIDAPADCPVAVGGEEPAATIEIDAPEVVEGPDVTVRLSTPGVTIRGPTGSGQDPRFGHYHLYLDQVPQLLHTHEKGEEEMADDVADYSKDIMWTQDTFTFEELEPGKHILFAALFYDNHEPFEPAVVSSATFTVKGEDGGGLGVWALIVAAIGAGVVGLGVGGGSGLALRHRR